MQVFSEKQHSLPSGINVVQVYNPTPQAVRVGHSGIYLGPREYAVGESNRIIERALRNGLLLLVPTETSTATKTEKYGKKTKKTEDVAEVVEAPEATESVNISSEEDQLVATETDYL